MSAYWKQLDALFEQALDLSQDALPSFLQHVQRDHHDVYPELLQLLQRDQQAPGFLDEHSSNLIATLLQDLVDEHESANSSSPLPAQIGPYRIQHEIGRGGMGIVYQALRTIDEHATQTVALKVIKRGMDTDAIVRRFKQERALLASLNHPNIARLIDGGTTDDGRPYFVMEHIDGQPITTYCDAHKLSVDERLALFETVCEAVQFAHQNLIVHRDLKPSNILVTASGRVKLLDFGIAKLLDTEQHDANGLPLTITGMRPLTPEYASPEQVRGEALTTASDVYALGVLLYELLVGQRPHAMQLQHEAVRLVAEGTVARPSTAVMQVATQSGDDEATTWILEARRMSADQLRRRLRGDVDSIAMKALAVEVQRRYGSAQLLGTDVRRHLAGLPVEARPDSVGYRVRKFVRRHRWGVSTSVAALVAVLGFAAFYSVNVTAERDRAQAEAAKAREMNDFFGDIFSIALGSGNPNVADTLLAKTVLQEAARSLDNEPDLLARPNVRGLLKGSLGAAFLDLERYPEAYTLFQEGLALQEAALGPNHIDLAFTLNDLSAYYFTLDSLEAATEMLTRGAQLVSQQTTPEDPEWVYFHQNASLAHRYLNNPDTAFYYLDAGLAYLDRFKTETPHIQNLRASIYADVASLHFELGRLDEAASLLARALTLMRPHVEEYGYFDYFQAMANYAVMARTLGDANEALGILDEALALEHPHLEPGELDMLGFVKVERIKLVLTRGSYAEARQHVVALLTDLEARYGDASSRLSPAEVLYASILRLQGQYAQAESVLHRARQRLLAIAGAETLQKGDVPWEWGQLAWAQGDFAQARDHFWEGTWRERAAQRPGQSIEYVLQSHLGYAHLYLGNLDSAQVLIEEAQAFVTENYVLTEDTRAVVRLHLGDLWLHRMIPDSAVVPLQEAIALIEQEGWHATYERLLWAQALLGQAYAQLGRYAEADSLLTATHAAMQANPATPVHELRHTRRVLYDLYTVWGKPEEAGRYAPTN